MERLALPADQGDQHIVFITGDGRVSQRRVIADAAEEISPSPASDVSMFGQGLEAGFGVGGCFRGERVLRGEFG